MSEPADSAGVPWAGRVLTGTGFDDDTGAADPALAQVIAYRVAQPSALADARLVWVLASARVLVPVVAVLGESVDGPPGTHTVDKTTDMSVVTLTAPDGRRALPVFTSATALSAWDGRARPVPVSGARAAQAAIAEGCQVLVVDLGTGQPTEVRPSMVWALAQGMAWSPAHTDPFVAQAVSRATSDEADVVAHRLDEGRPTASGVLRVVLAVPPGLDAAAVEALATRVGERLATDGELRARVDELAFSVEPFVEPVEPFESVEPVRR